MTSENVDMTEARAPETRGVASVRSNHESTIGPRNDKPELRLEKEVISVVTCGFTPTFHAGKSLLGKGTSSMFPGRCGICAVLLNQWMVPNSISDRVGFRRIDGETSSKFIRRKMYTTSNKAQVGHD